MNLTLDIVFIITGFALLIFGGDVLVRVAVQFAVRYKIPPATIGLTVVAAGTSLPELVTSIVAALQGNADIAVGNVVGSNSFNIMAGIGLACLIRPNRVQKSALKIEWPFLMLITIGLYLVSTDLLIGRIDGSLMLFVLVAFFWYAVKNAKKIGLEVEDEDIPAEVKDSVAKDLGLLVLGLIALIGGAELTLTGAINLGKYFGLSDRVIGLTIVSAGTGLPELATSAMAAYRGRDDIAIANVLGSNIMNILAILGVTSLITPLQVNSDIVNYDMIVCMIVTFILLPMMLKKVRSIMRWEGMILLGMYIAYVASLL